MILLFKEDGLNLYMNIDIEFESFMTIYARDCRYTETKGFIGSNWIVLFSENILILDSIVHI